ncbi:hypothetical protein PV326_008088 [Microctonus aethiopoides]|nr:hypothetical protein PV326_008088 [Microctonus aethiopoides]
MRTESEATRQIVEFEELVSRLDRINDLHDSDKNNSTTSTKTFTTTAPPLRRSTNNVTSVHSYNLSPVRLSPYARQDVPLSFPRSCREDSRRVRINIGIDDDLRMILEMDPSIVDQQLPAQPILSSSLASSQSVTSYTTQLTKTRVNNNCCWTPSANSLAPHQGWYWQSHSHD